MNDIAAPVTPRPPFADLPMLHVRDRQGVVRFVFDLPEPMRLILLYGHCGQRRPS